jgi:hypothetical protein
VPLGLECRLMRQVLDWLGQNPTATTVASGVGGALCGAGLRQDWGKPNALLWVLGIAVSILLPALGTKRNRLQQGAHAARRCIKNALAACGAAHGYPERHVRVNIMCLSRDGRKRTVEKVTAFNMDADPDCDLEIDASAGVSGEALRQRVPTWGDLALSLQPGGPKWGLTDSQKAKVRSTLKSVLSVPIFDPENPDGDLLGTLQVDSDLTIAEMEFDRPERQAVAERFSDVVALLLKEGR